MHHYDKSEKIREEQNKLIKSLQREIDILRDSHSLNHQKKTNEEVKRPSVRSEKPKENENKENSSNEIKEKLNNHKKTDKSKKKSRSKIKTKSVDKKKAEASKTPNRPKKMNLDKTVAPKSQKPKLK